MRSGASGFFFQAEDGIRDLVRSRGLGDVYKRQGVDLPNENMRWSFQSRSSRKVGLPVLSVRAGSKAVSYTHLTLPTIYPV